MKLWKRNHYEKMLGIKTQEKTVQYYEQEITKMQESIRRIQESCEHKNEFIGYYSRMLDTWTPSAICSNCHKFLRVANDEEAEKLRNESLANALKNE